MALTSQQRKQLADVASNGDEMAASFNRYVISDQYIWDNYLRLKKEFPDQYVAVGDGELIAHDTDIEKVMEQIGQSGLDRGVVALRFIASKPRRLVLHSDHRNF